MRTMHVARLAVTAGLCASMILSGVPTQAIAEELTTTPVLGLEVAEDETEGAPVPSEAPDPVEETEADGEPNAETLDTSEVTGTSAPRMSAPAAEPNEVAAGGVAEVNGTQYASLQDAINAAGNSGTVKLVDNVLLEKTVNVIAGNEVTLDLNGKQVTVPEVQQPGRSLYAFEIKSGATFHLTDSAGGGKVASRGIMNYGTMTMDSGWSEAIDSNGGGAAIWNEGNLTMTGGKLSFSGEKMGNNSGQALTNTGNAVADISGVTFDAKSRAVDHNSANPIKISNCAITNTMEHWNAVRIENGNAELCNVTINSTMGGCLEASMGSTVDLYDCTFNQAGYYDWTSSVLASSIGATLNVHSGTYTGENYGAYIFNSGGTINFYDGTLAVTGDKAAIKGDLADGKTAEINIEGGAVKGGFEVVNAIDMEISGGSFTVKPDGKYLADGHSLLVDEKGESTVDTTAEIEKRAGAAVEKDGTTTYYTTVEAAQSQNEGIADEDIKQPTIKVGEDAYFTLASAVQPASDSGDPIVLTADITDTCDINVGQKVVIDLNGKTLAAASGSEAAFRAIGGELTIKDSSATSTVPVISSDYKTVTYEGSGKVTSSRAAVRVYSGGTLKMESGSIDSTNGVAVYIGSTSAERGNGHFEMTGGYIHAYSAAVAYFAQGTTARVSDGVIVSEENAPLMGNGTSHGTEATVSGGTLISHCTTDGYNACGIYHPQSGKLTITGGEIYADGGAGVLMRAGSADITGGTIIATGTEPGWVGDKRAEIPCSGVVVEHLDPGYPGTTDEDVVNISGDVTIKCDNSLPVVQVMAPEGTSVKGDVVISGGTFSGGEIGTDLLDDEAEFQKNEDGSVTVVEKKVAQIGETTYPSLAKAFEAAAKAGGPVVIGLLGDCSWGGNLVLTDNEDVVLDLNGHTLNTGSYPLVVENGAGLVVIGDGKIENTMSDKASGEVGDYDNAILVRAGGSLELDGVEITSYYGIRTYGETNIKRATIIAKHGWAIGVLNSAKVVIGDPSLSEEENNKNVIVKSANNCISSAAAYSNDDLLVIIHGGTFTGSTKPDNPGDPWNSGPVYWPAKGTLDIRGGHFEANLPSSVSKGTAAVLQKNGTVKISGGVFKAVGASPATGDGFKVVVQKDTDAISTEVTGGTFEGTRSGFYADASAAPEGFSYVTDYNVAIKGGSFDGGTQGALYTKNDGSAAQGKQPLQISGGVFDELVASELCAPGYAPVTTPNAQGEYTVEVPEGKRVASIGGRYYPTLQEAIDNAPAGAMIKLEGDKVTENVIVPEGSDITLDLNGKTLSGGTVAGKAALTNHGSIVIQDTSSPSTGRIVREDEGVPAYYTIDNQGTMTIKSGTVYNNSGTDEGAGSSLIRNAGVKESATLNIEGGRLQQDNFIVVKNDDHGILNVTGGEIVTTAVKADAKNMPSAIQNWAQANISGGKITGAVWTGTWSADLPESKTSISGNVEINGVIRTQAEYASQGNNKRPDVSITGGDINTKDYGFKIENPNDIEISGGTFNSPIDEDYFANGHGIGKPNSNGDYVVGDETFYTIKYFFEKIDSNNSESEANYEEDAKAAKVVSGVEPDASFDFNNIPAGPDGKPASDDDHKGYDLFKLACPDTVANDGSSVVSVYYNRETYSVSFKNDDKVLDTKTVKYEGKATRPDTDPTKDGHNFLGWFAEGSDKAFDFENTQITADLTLVAKWERKTYTITFDSNGGEPVKSMSVKYGEKFKAPDAKRDGYTLNYWEAGPDTIQPGHEHSGVKSDIAYTAVWLFDAPANVSISADKDDEHAGDTVVLTASATHGLGGKVLSYQWYKDDVALEGQTGKTLSVTDAGTYHVAVSAKNGNDTSGPVRSSNTIELTFDKRDVTLSFTKDSVEKHVNADNFTNGVVLSAQAVGNVAYSIDNADVATVDSATGEVTIKAPGTAKITASVPETETHKGATATYALTVTPHKEGEWVTTVEPTCTTEGKKELHCSVEGCNELLKTESIAKKSHTLTETPANPATCDKPGNDVYWTCDECRKVFSDKDGKDETTVEDRITPALGHDLVKVDGKPSTCTDAGVAEHYRCDREGCGALFSDADGQHSVTAEELIIKPLGHTSDKGMAVELPTCTEEGSKEYRCTECCALLKTESIPALGHELAATPAKPATCTESGNNAYWTCSACDRVYSDEDGKDETTVEEQIIPALGHDFGDWVVTTSPTCTEKGEETRSCATCALEETREVEPLGHKLAKVDGKPATCTDAGVAEHYRCDHEGCGALFADADGKHSVTADELVIQPLGHKLAKVPAVEPTAEAEGNKEYWECDTCGALFWDAKGTDKIDSKDETIIPKLKVYKVTFDDCLKSTEELAVFEVVEGRAFSDANKLPADPECKGYEFKGWFHYDVSAKEWGEEFDPEEPVTDDLHIAAKWEKLPSTDDGQGEQDQTEKPTKPGDSLAQTGDTSVAPIVVLGAVGAAVIMAGVIISRKNKK